MAFVCMYVCTYVCMYIILCILCYVCMMYDIVCTVILCMYVYTIIYNVCIHDVYIYNNYYICGSGPLLNTYPPVHADQAKLSHCPMNCVLCMMSLEVVTVFAVVLV